MDGTYKTRREKEVRREREGESASRVVEKRAQHSYAQGAWHGYSRQVCERDRYKESALGKATKMLPLQQKCML